MENRHLHLTATKLIARHRRLLAALFAAAAVALALAAVSPSPPERVEIAVASRDLSGGTAVTADDVAATRVPPAAVPDGLLSQHEVVDRVLAAPMRAGEPFTDRRLVGSGLLSGWDDDLVATPVRLADPTTTTLLRIGDRINLLATDGTSAARVIADDVPVLTIAPGTDALGSDSLAAESAVLVVGATDDQAAQLARAAVTSQLTFTIGAPPT